MKLRQPLAALGLALMCGTAFAANAATPATPATPASAAAPAKAKVLHCKKGYTDVKGKCAKAKPKA